MVIDGQEGAAEGHLPQLPSLETFLSLFPVPSTWISYILITYAILKSASPAIIQALLMTPSTKVSIMQVGIRRAESKAGRRAEHGLRGAGNPQGSNGNSSKFTKRSLLRILHACRVGWPLAGLQPVTPNHSKCAGQGYMTSTVQSAPVAKA